MTRFLSLLAFAALVAVLLLSPDASRNHLATLDVGSLLDEPVVGSEPEAEDAQTLFAALLESNGVERMGDEVIMRLAGCRVESELEEAFDIYLHEEARLSVVRKIRAKAAEEGLPLTVDRQLGSATEDTINFKVEVSDSKLRLGFAYASEPMTWAEKDFTPPSRSSIAPALIAIFLAILFRRPILALFTGVFLGSILFLHGGGESLGASVPKGLLQMFPRFWDQLIDPDRYFIILFVIFMLAMVGVMTRSGGIRGVMDKISGFAKDARRSQIATWFMGLAIFFDDYANAILVGSTMRPITDRFKVAREKLAYIVDSTAAPVAGISIFSTWIAFEVSTFSAQLPDAGLMPADGYSVFMQTLPYRFYCIFTLIFVAMLVFSGRDFGPMLRAERRARGGKVLRDGAKPMVSEASTALVPAEGMGSSMWLALAPLLTFLGVTLFMIAYGGDAFDMGSRFFTREGLAEVLGKGSGSKPLMQGSLAGMLVAMAMGLGAGLGGETLKSAWNAIRSMGIAIAILFLAWMIGQVCNDLGTALYLTALLKDIINPITLPCILFILAGVVAFSTGSSWSTMSILLPLVVGLSFQLGASTPIGDMGMMVLCIGAVLEGAIFGDHCSPISDTTIMSSIASASDHIDHVRTQAPYAIVTMLVAMLVGYFPCAFFGWSPWLSLLLGVGVLALILRFYGERADDEPAPAQ